MKNFIKSIIAVATLLLCSTNTWAGSFVVPIIQVDGQANEAGGTVTIDKPEATAGETVTITAKPNDGYYLDPANVTVIKTIDGAFAQTRDATLSTPLTVTHASGDDITGEATFTFVMPDTGKDGVLYGAEVTVNFQTRTDISTATVTADGTFAYTGDPIVPETITVKLGSSTLTETTDYSLLIENNTNPGKATIIATGVGKYTGSATGEFTIDKAEATLKYSKETAEATLQAEFEAPTLTVTPVGLEGITYSSSNTNAATIAEDGKVTIVGAGETTIKASFGGNDYYKEAEASYVLTVNKIATELKYSKETATATMNAEFEAPTLTKTPENLEGVEFTSSNTAAATVDKNTGAVTLVGGGETTIKAAFAGSDTYEASEASYVLTVSKAKTELKFSKETATATMNAEFGAPTLTVTPEGLEGVKYSSSDANVATVNETTGAVTLVGAGEAVIKASFAGTTVYEAAEASYTLTVSKVTTTLKFAEETATAIMGAEFAAPTLTVTPEGLQGVKYSSSNTNVATVNETTGAVTLVGAGETTIKASFAGTTVYEAAETSYTLTVNRAQSEGYGLWINNIQVTEDNQDDVLGNSADSKSGTMGTIVFNPKKNTLVMTNDVSNVEIESRLESLTLHINDVNQVKRIFYNNLGDATNTGELIITTNGNFPGQLIIKNDAGKSAISGFSKLTLEQDLLFVEPELVELKNGELYQYDFKKVDPTDPESKLIKDDATEAICNAVTIGVIITPLTQNVTVLLTKGDDFIVKDENGNPVTDTNGNPVPASLKNFALSKDILLTIWTDVDEQNSQAGQEVDAGFDDSDGKPGITMVNTMTDAQVQKVAKDVLKNIIMPGGTTFAYEFNGVTFIVPAGSGSIIIDQETDPGYEYHLAPIGLNETYNLVIGGAKIEKYELLGGNRVRLTIDYSNLPTQTYYLLYLTQEASSGARGGTRLGKRDKAHGKLYSVGVRPRSITDVNPPSEASGNVINEAEDPKGVIDNPTPPTPPTGIQTVASESSVNSNKWFTADGRQLESKPTKPGFYIRNGKKVILK